MSVDPLAYSASFVAIRTGLFAAMAAYLLVRWRQKPDRFYTDIPFLMAVSFLVMAVVKSIDLALLFSEAARNPVMTDPTTPEELQAFYLLKTRYYLIVFPVAIYVFVLGRVWLYGRKKLQYGLTLAYSALLSLLVLPARNYLELTSALPLFVVPLLIFGISFLLLHYKRSLSQVNCFLLGAGFVAYFVSSLARPLIQSGTGSILAGLILPELVDIVVWTVIFASFLVKPGYLRKAEAS